MWPITVSHKIDVSSPLYDFGPQQLADGMMEVKMIVLWSFVLFGIYLLCLHLFISRWSSRWWASTALVLPSTAGPATSATRLSGEPG